MVIKETELKSMNKDIYKLLTELLQFEVVKSTFLLSGKTYFKFHGLDTYRRFFDQISDKCSTVKDKLIENLLSENDEIPEMSMPSITINFENAIDVFKQLAEFEEKGYGLFEELVVKTFEAKEIKILAFALSIVKDEDHICCRALEAVKNNNDPNKLINCIANDIPW